MNNISKTKIIATIGPSSWDDNVLEEMFSFGMQMARINASFANFEELQRVSTQLRQISPRIGLILDTQGNKIRIKGLQKDLFVQNSIVLSSVESNNSDIIQITYPRLHECVTKNTRILLDDGNIELKVNRIDEVNIICDVIQAGTLKPNKTVNIPDINLDFPVLTEKDRNDILFATKNNFDFISASFVRNKQDVLAVKELIKESNLGIISKIENREGINNFDEILKVSDGIMIARGDLGVEIDLEEIPVLQKQMIYKCRSVGKPVIVATQMLESMRENIRPTRAEVSDIANAVMDGTDCLMLSAETSTGRYPEKAVSVMNRVALKAESVMQASPVYGKTEAGEEVDELGKSLCHLVESLSLKAIIVISDNQSVIGSISRHRPNTPIYVVSKDIKSIRKNIIYRGVKTYLINDLSNDRDINIIKATECIYTHGELDLTDKIAIISGSSIQNKKYDSILEILTVKDILNS